MDGHYVSTESAGACQTSCQNTAGCEFWSWTPDYHNACWKKSGKGVTISKPGVTSGPKQCSIDGSTHIPPTQQPPNPDGNHEIKVMSYNLFGWNALGKESWKAENVYKVIRAFNPDLLGTQEINALADNVASNIGSDYAVAHGGYSAGHAILYRTSVFDYVKSGKQTLTYQDYWGERTVEYAQLIHKASGRNVDHFNTHFCVYTKRDGKCGGTTPGLTSAHEVESFMTKNRRPGSLMLLTGDFNAFNGFENHPAIKYLKGESSGDMPPYILEDTFRVANGGYPNDAAGKTFGSAGKIDYLFAEKGSYSNVVSAAIDRKSYGPASDHYPINAVIDF